MHWATHHVRQLQAGETVQFRPRGSSMTPRIRSGQLVTVEPCTAAAVGDVVLCRVLGHVYLHLVAKIGADGRYLITNNHGRVNGWTRTLYGRVVQVEP